MARIDIKGDITINEYKRYYDFLKWDATCPRDVETIIAKAARDEPIDVYISSPGGFVTAGQEIYTALRGDSRIHIHITGQACSAASMIAMAGPSDITPVGLLMVHQASIENVGGNQDDLGKVLGQLKSTDKAIAEAYVQKSGMDISKALALMAKETWLTANQCVELGLVDAIAQPDSPAPQAAASIGGVRLTEEMRHKIDADIKQREENSRKKNELLDDLDFYGI